MAACAPIQPKRWSVRSSRPCWKGWRGNCGGWAQGFLPATPSLTRIARVARRHANSAITARSAGLTRGRTATACCGRRKPRRTTIERTRAGVSGVHQDRPGPIGGFSFCHPEGFADVDYRGAGGPFPALERIEHVFLPIAIEQVDDIALANRETQVFVQLAALRQERTPHRKAGGN